MTRILLYSAEPMSALGFSSLLANNSNFLPVGTCSNTNYLNTIIDLEKPDILLLDLTADVNFQLLRDLKQKFDTCKILLWVDTISTELAFQAMGLGVYGIVRKALSADELMECLQKVSNGELWFEKKLTESMLSARKVSLTRREGQLVTLLSQGMKNKAMAIIMGVSENTIKVYLSRLFAKVGVKDRFELALQALRNVAAGQGRLDKPIQKESLNVQQDVIGLRSLMMGDGLRK